jgi:hypothetical protein
MTILIVARDVAGAHAVGTVAQELAKNHPLHILAEDIAAVTLPTYGLTVSPLDEPLEVRFERLKPRLVLTGTSIQPGLEKQSLVLAREYGIPSLALLDSWTQYAARFNDLETGETLRYLPDKLAVFDQTSLDELTALGIPPDRIVVTGNPYFSRLAYTQPEHSRAFVRAELGIPLTARMVVFISEPLPDFWYTRFATNYPSGEEIEETLRLCAEALAEVENSAFVVKLHPIEEPSLAQRALGELPGQLVGRYDPTSLVKASDLVVGMNSNLLLESALAGCPTYSILLDKYKNNGRASIAVRFGSIGLLNTEEAIRAVVKGEHLPPTRSPRHVLYQGALEAILALIAKMLD